MEQYKKSGPAPDPEKQYTRAEVDLELKKLQDLWSQQSALISKLETELRRLKSKLDAHAATINQMKKNG